MKHIFTTAIFTLSAAVFAADITENFDEVLWPHWNAASCKVQYRQSKNGIKNTPCAEIVFQPEHNSAEQACLLKKYTLISGKQYEAGVMVKNAAADKNATALILIQSYSGTGKFDASLVSVKRKAPDDWQRLSCTFTVPEKITTVQVILGASGNAGADILFDDFSIKEVSGIIDHFDSEGSVSFWKFPEAKTKFFYEENDGKQAKGCAGVEIMQGNPKKYGGFLLRRVSVKPGKEYTFIVQAKTIGLADDAQIGLNIQGQDSKKRFLGTGVQGTNIKAETCRDWKQMVFTYKIPIAGKWEKCAFLLVTLGTTGEVPGKVLFDDFECFLNEEE